MVRCAVIGCKNYQGKKENGNIIRFFCFPTNAKQSREWLRICRCDQSVNPKIARVCANHFSRNDYKLQHLLLNIPEKKRRLRAGAVPSINVPKTASAKRKEKSEIDERKELVEQAISHYDRKYTMEISQHFAEPEVDAPTTSRKRGNGGELEMEDPLGDPGPQAKYLIRENRTLAHHIEKLRKRVHLAENAVANMEKIFTEGQVKRIKNPNKHYKWNFDDISYAACLYAAGPPAYSLLVKRNYPLPKIASLKKWATDIESQPGIIQSTLNAMSEANYQDLERLCILSFHEIVLKKSLRKEPGDNQDPPKIAYIVIARGLITDWKQVVYYEYDCDKPAEVLKEIVHVLNGISFTVVAIVSDVGYRKYQLWTELEVNQDRPYIEYINGDKVFFFGNTPHLIKTFRNCFIKFGIIMRNKRITIEPLQELLTPGMPDLDLGFKLIPAHLSDKKDARRNSLLTQQLLSQPLALALRRCTKLGKITSKYAIECSDIIQLFSDWTDVFNSDEIKGDPPVYGKALDEQNTIILMMNDLMRKINKCRGKTSIAFQKGILLNNAALVQMHSYLIEKYNVKYISTMRFNQDDLEQQFRIKRSGTHFGAGPTAMEFKYKINSIRLSCLNTIKKKDE